MKVEFTRLSMLDIDTAYRGLAEKNPAAAQRLEDLIRATAESLAQFARVGAPTDIESVRRLPLVHYPYTIFYRVSDVAGRVEILRVVHSASVKDLRRLPD